MSYALLAMSSEELTQLMQYRVYESYEFCSTTSLQTKVRQQVQEILLGDDLIKVI